jgi:hypothetical protein
MDIDKKDLLRGIPAQLGKLGAFREKKKMKGEREWLSGSFYRAKFAQA